MVPDGAAARGTGTGTSTAGGSDLLDIGAKLTALAANGGPEVGAANSTLGPAELATHAPASDSPLLDRGAPTGCVGPDGLDLVVDQRGLLRAVDGPDPDAVATCDIGAYERQAGPQPNPIFSNGFE